MSNATILIVDDNFVVRRGLQSYLSMQESISVLGEASNSTEAIDWIKRNHADVVLMDIRMPGKDGIEATAEIIKVRPDTKVLILTVLDKPSTLLRACLSGAKGCLVYGYFTPEDLVGAISVIASGGNKMIPQINPALMRAIEGDLLKINKIAEFEEMEPLTAREEEVLGLIATGRNNCKIAGILGVEEKTIKNHINNIYSKLQLKSRYEAIRYVFENCRQSIFTE